MTAPPTGHPDSDDPGPDPQPEPAREPDYRFTLANERTFLAWMRTSLALLAAGVALHQFVPPDWIPGGRAWPALLCVLLSITLALGAARRWAVVQRAMRRGDPLPPSRLIYLVAAGIVAFGVVVLLGVSRS